LSQTVGPRLWRIAKANSLHTLGDYLELRFNRAVRGIIAVVLWFGTLAILAGQIIAIAWILNVVIGLPKWAGCLAGGSVAILYCVAGGLASTAIVNILELAVTMSGLILAAIFAVNHAGGISALFSAAAAQTQSLKPGYTSITGAGAKQILAYVAILVPSFICSPGLVQKLYGARDERAVRIGVALNSAGQLVFAFVPALFGMIAVVALPALTNPELALPSVMTHAVPRWIGLWALAAVFSAELSATDAILFMLSSSLSIDLYKTFLNPSATQQKLLRVGRIATVAAGAAGIGLAVALPSVISAVTIFYGLLAVGLFVPLIFGLYWKRMTTVAALVSIAGAIAADLAAFTFTRGSGIGLLSPHAFGILVALALASAMSIFGPQQRSAEVLPDSRAASRTGGASR
ncbi:MAG TPA: sodium:solute symporter family protein, partial [Candidatus Acidoferrales bacterium]|nr:sodium:solute symporter family protein [Candidatus Acidoferrales bacterium]